MTKKKQKLNWDGMQRPGATLHTGAMAQLKMQEELQKVEIVTEYLKDMGPEELVNFYLEIKTGRGEDIENGQVPAEPYATAIDSLQEILNYYEDLE